MGHTRIALCASMLAVGAATAGAAAAADWPAAGRDLQNSRYQADEKLISPRTVSALQLRWALDTDGDVTANPAVDGEHLYFPDSAGSLYEVHRQTGTRPAAAPKPRSAAPTA